MQHLREYAYGFGIKCAESGVDPIELVKLAAAPVRPYSGTFNPTPVVTPKPVVLIKFGRLEKQAQTQVPLPKPPSTMVKQDTPRVQGVPPPILNNGAGSTQGRNALTAANNSVKPPSVIKPDVGASAPSQTLGTGGGQGAFVTRGPNVGAPGAMNQGYPSAANVQKLAPGMSPDMRAAYEGISPAQRDQAMEGIYSGSGVKGQEGYSAPLNDMQRSAIRYMRSNGRTGVPGGPPLSPAAPAPNLYGTGGSGVNPTTPTVAATPATPATPAVTKVKGNALGSGNPPPADQGSPAAIPTQREMDQVNAQGPLPGGATQPVRKAPLTLSAATDGAVTPNLGSGQSKYVTG